MPVPPHDARVSILAAMHDEQIAVRPVESEQDVEALRRLRNCCRLFMTRDQRRITVERQRAWWAGRPPDLKAYLISLGPSAVAFGVIREESGRWWISLGIESGYRGRGIGTAIYRFLIAQSPEPPWIEVRADNVPSLRAAARAGFQVVDCAQRVWTLRAGAQAKDVPKHDCAQQPGRADEREAKGNSYDDGDSSVQGGDEPGSGPGSGPCAP